MQNNPARCLPGQAAAWLLPGMGLDPVSPEKVLQSARAERPSWYAVAMANLLIVEDDGLLRDALGAQLAQAGHTVTPAADGALAQGLPVLVLTARDPQALRERLTKVLAGAQRSAHLVQQLLSLARNEAEVRLQSLDLAALARDVARDWTPRALAAGVDLGYEGAEALSIQGEPLLLREALNNLLDNALNYAGAPEFDTKSRFPGFLTLRP